MSDIRDVAVGAAAGVAAATAYEAYRRSLERDVLDGKPTRLEKIDPRTINADPETFQFKSGGDNKGVTDRLKDVRSWDPVAAGKGIVFEKADGTRVIADGHQRLGLATRLATEGQSVRMDAYVMRERDGWTPRDVRAYAAIKNMQEGSGASLDMAKVMRERPDLVNTGRMPLSDTKVREAKSLAQLSEPAFKMVVGGAVKPEHAAAVGGSVKDAGRHADMISEMIKAKVESAQHARLYVSQAMAAPTITESHASLFGEETSTRSLLAERAKVLDKALSALKSDKRIFGLLEREASNIEAAGNKLAHETNIAKAEGAGKLASLVEKLSTTRGAVSTMLDRAAAAVANGEPPSKAARAFVRQVGDVMKQGGMQGLMGDAPARMQMMADTPKQSSMFGAPSTADKIAAEVRAKEAKGRTGDPMNEGLFGSSAKQTDLVEMAKSSPKAPAGLTGDSRYKFVGESRTLERGPVAVYMDKVSGVHVVADRNGAFDISGNPMGARQAPSGIEMAAAAANPDARFHASASKITDHVEFKPAEGLKGPAGWSDAAREASADARKADPHAAERERIANGTKRIGDTYKAPAPAAPTAADKFTSGMKPMAAAKAKAALETQVRHNRNEFLTRAALVERQIANGASVQTMKIGGKEQRVLMGKDGAFLDSRAITKAGLDYAEHLAASKPTNPNYTPGVGTTQEGYWSRKSPPTPTVNELPPGAFKGTQRDFESLSPGMRREIKRAADLEAIKQKTRDALGPNGDGKVRRTDGSLIKDNPYPVSPEAARNIDRLERLGHQPFRDAAKALNIDSTGGNSEIRARIEAASAKDWTGRLQAVADQFETSARSKAEAELKALVAKTGASADVQAKAVAAGMAEHDRVDRESMKGRPGWSDEARAASAEVRGEKAMAKNPVSEAERAGRINRLQNRAGAGGLSGKAAEAFVADNLAKLEALDAKRAANEAMSGLDKRIENAKASLSIGKPSADDIARKDQIVTDRHGRVQETRQKSPLDLHTEGHREVKIGNSRIGYQVKADGTVHVSGIRTAQANRGKGSARAAMNEFLATADAKGVNVDLHASPLDRRTGTAGLVRFYESLGFQKTGRTINPMGDPAMVRPAKPRIQEMAEDIKDFGEKIGGSRKDRAAKTAPKSGAGKKALGPLALVAIGAAALVAANRSAEAGETKVKQAQAAGKEAAVGAGVMAGFVAGTAVIAKGFMKAGLTAAKAAPATQAVLMAGGAIHGAVTAAPGERMKGAARGAWDMSLPGMVVNTGAAVKDAVVTTRARSAGPARLTDQQQSLYADASKRHEAMREAAQSDGTGKKQGWSNAARIGAYKARMENAGQSADSLPYGGNPANGPSQWAPSASSSDLSAAMKKR